MADSTNTLLENTSVPTLVHKFALPAILSNLVGSLYNIADQIFIGQKLGTVGNAATNIAFPPCSSYGYGLCNDWKRWFL